MVIGGTMKRKRISKIVQIEWKLKKLNFLIFALTCKSNDIKRKNPNQYPGGSKLQYPIMQTIWMKVHG